MNISSLFAPTPTAHQNAAEAKTAAAIHQVKSQQEQVALSPAQQEALNKAEERETEFRETFAQFVGQTFFGQLMASMRKTVGKSELFHGGRGEEIFQQQMDQIFVERMSESTADQLANPMYDLLKFNHRR